MSAAQLLSNNILGSKGMIDSFLKDFFTDAEMYFRPAKAANHATWQMGHLCNATLGMVKSCSPSVAFPFKNRHPLRQEQGDHRRPRHSFRPKRNSSSDSTPR